MTGDSSPDDLVEPERPTRRGGVRGLLADRPRLIILLIGGVSLGGIVCMCLAVAALAYWQR